MNDPLVDPQPGDVIQYGNTVRQVMERDGQDVWYLSNGNPGLQPLSRWPMWGKNRKAGDAVLLQRGAPVDPDWITAAERAKMLRLRAELLTG